MRKLLVLAFALTLAACATYKNPVTQSRVDALNASWGAALALAANYRDACAQRLLPPSCRTIVVRMQQASRPVHAAVVRARDFARNPTISAQDLLQVASDAVNDFKVRQMEWGVR